MTSKTIVPLRCFDHSEIKMFEDGYTLYQKYADMRSWLYENNVLYKFQWDDPGRYYPNSVVMDRESALAFILKYNV